MKKKTLAKILLLPVFGAIVLSCRGPSGERNKPGSEEVTNASHKHKTDTVGREKDPD